MCSRTKANEDNRTNSPPKRKSSIITLGGRSYTGIGRQIDLAANASTKDDEDHDTCEFGCWFTKPLSSI